jgi:hypothetical protein
LPILEAYLKLRNLVVHLRSPYVELPRRHAAFEERDNWSNPLPPPSAPAPAPVPFFE